MTRKTPWWWEWPISAANPHGYSLWGGAARVAFGAALLLLAACTTPPVVQEVKVPVYRPCVTAAPSRPTFATRTLAPDASDGEKVLALARDLPVHLKYEAQLEAVIAGCL